MDSRKVPSQIPSEKMALYRSTAQHRQTQQQQQLEQRRERAWRLARQGAALLRAQFGMGRVVVFGSLSCSDRWHSRSELLMDKAQRSGNDGYLDGVALNLHGFYAGVERILEDVARSFDKSLPSGAEWHRDLLLQMSAEVASVRPPVISQETRYCLVDNYRGFRHIVRNVYTFNLRPARLQELIDELQDCYAAVIRNLSDFVAFLGQLSEDGKDT